MNKEFIPYEQALSLKELGFDEPCFGWWSITTPNIELIIEHVFPGEFKTSTLFAPLYQQAFRWFREKYNLHAEITWSPSYEYEPGQWSDAIYEITIVNVSYTKEWEAESPDMQRANGRQLTYEEAELACLIKLIEIVK
jgi:hypothetical protein